jgi:hypothetical protein
VLQAKRVVSLSSSLSRVKSGGVCIKFSFQPVATRIDYIDPNNRGSATGGVGLGICGGSGNVWRALEIAQIGHTPGAKFPVWQVVGYPRLRRDFAVPHAGGCYSTKIFPELQVVAAMPGSFSRYHVCLQVFFCFVEGARFRWILFQGYRRLWNFRYH